MAIRLFCRKPATRWIVVLLGAALSLLLPVMQSESAAAGKGETVTVSFSYPPFGYSAAAEKAFWSKHIKSFEAANPGIEIQMTWESWGNIFQKTTAAVASGKVPDLSYNSPPQIMPLAKQGHILPVDDTIAALGGRDAFQSALISQFELEGKTYCVPNSDNNLVLCYRKDMLKTAGFTSPPKDWNELVTVAKAATGNGVYGLGLYLGKTYDTRQVYAGMMWAAGGTMLDPAGNVSLDSPENLAALTFYTDLYLKHKVVPPGAVDWKYGDNANIIGTGQVAMTPIWGGYGTLIEEMFPETYKEIGFAELPAGPTGHSGSWSGAGGFFVFAKAAHPAEAKAFIRYMSTPGVHKEWCVISGNVSPFRAIANDPELTRYDWYRAIAQQSANAVQIGWSATAAVPGLEIVGGQHVLAEPVVGVITDGLSPEVSLKKAHAHMVEILERAKNR